MDSEPTKLTAGELADLAVECGIHLGKNPRRTILYYKSMDLLRPEIVQEGSARRAYYSKNHLVILRVINEMKNNKGQTLEEIRQALRDQVFLSDYGRAFIEKYRIEIPDNVFQLGEPLNYAETAFLISKAISIMPPEETLRFLSKAVVRSHGQPIADDLGETIGPVLGILKKG